MIEKSELENLDNLFEQLNDGEMPNFLDVMAALSDVSKIWPVVEPVCTNESCPNC